MKTLGASIVQRGIATVGDVEEALARQVMYGGDLATNLLELASVSEDELTELLATSHGLRPAPSGELPVAGAAVRRLVPGDLAFRHGFYPLYEDAGTLTVAVAEPIASEVEQDLTFALGVKIVQLAAPLVRIRQAVARDYQLSLDKRTERILSKLLGQPTSLSEPPRVDIGALPRPETLPPSAYASDSAVDMEAPTAPPPEVYPIHVPESSLPDFSGPPTVLTDDDLTDVADESQPGAAPLLAMPDAHKPGNHSPRAQVLKSAAQELARQSRPPQARPHRRLGPYTVANAERDLMNAEERDEVINAFFDFACQYFEYTALFVMHGDLAEGRDARGPGASPEKVRTLGIPLDLPSAVSTVHDRGKWLLVRLSGGGIDSSLAKDLERQSGPQCLLLPLMMRKRCVLILYGDHGEDDVSLSDIGDVISFAPLVAAGLERIILKRKRSMRRQAGLPSQLPPVPERRSQVPLPTRKERAQALAGVLDAASKPPPAPAASSSSASPAPPPPATRRSEPPKAAERPAAAELPGRESHRELRGPRTESGLGPSAPVAPPAPEPVKPDRSAALSGHAVTEEDTRTSVVPQRVLSIEPPADPMQELLRTQLSPGSSGKPAPAAPAEKPQVALTSPPLAEEPPEDGWDIESRRIRTESSPESAATHAPEIDVGTTELDRETRDAIAREERAPLAPASRSVSYSARPPSRRQSSEELRLPSVIVDFESDVRALVELLRTGNLDAAERLVEMGPRAVSALVAEFPGPITHDLRRGSSDSPVRASECGPILRTLVRIGSPAVPFLVVRTADANPEIRAWATRILAELPGRESGLAVAKRLVDLNQDVRRAALAAARTLQRDPQARAAIREHLADLAQDGARTNDLRHAAVEALSDIRDPEAVPVFIRVLGNSNRELTKSAHWGLAVLCRTDLGSDASAWEKWWRKNAGRHRVEWLIDALMHENDDIRRAAGDELKNITKEYFGYYDDLPKKERAAAQARYREWWDSTGRSRFA